MDWAWNMKGFGFKGRYD